MGGSELVHVHQGPPPLFCEIQTHRLILAIGSFPAVMLERTTKLCVRFHVYKCLFSNLISNKAIPWNPQGAASKIPYIRR